MSEIVTLTVNPTLDLNTSVPHVAAEQKLRCGRPTYEPGGGGVNVARAIVELGGEALAVLACGGPTGRRISQCLHAEGVPHRAVSVEGESRQNLIVLEEASGQQYRFGMPGPELATADAERCLEALQAVAPPDLLVLSGSLPPGLPDDFYARAARTAHARTRVILDTSGPALRGIAQAPVYLIKPNLRELQLLTEKPLQSDREVQEAAHGLVERGYAEVVVVSLGRAGAMLVTAQQQLHLKAPTVPIRSKVGAGDSMVAGITLGLARGKTLDDAVRLGVAAGAAAVMTDGSQLCRREDVDTLYGQVTEP